MTSQLCPICQNSMQTNPRYPRAVCLDCVTRATDENGRHVFFFNSGMSGGMEGQYPDDGSVYPADICFISGYRCKASEARMGGIVIEVL